MTFFKLLFIILSVWIFLGMLLLDSNINRTNITFTIKKRFFSFINFFKLIVFFSKIKIIINPKFPYGSNCLDHGNYILIKKTKKKIPFVIGTNQKYINLDFDFSKSLFTYEDIALRDEIISKLNHIVKKVDKKNEKESQKIRNSKIRDTKKHYGL